MKISNLNVYSLPVEGEKKYLHLYDKDIDLTKGSIKMNEKSLQKIEKTGQRYLGIDRIVTRNS